MKFTWNSKPLLHPSSCKLTKEKNYVQTRTRKTQAQQVVEDKHTLEDEQTLKHMVPDDLKLPQN